MSPVKRVIVLTLLALPAVRAQEADPESRAGIEERIKAARAEIAEVDRKEGPDTTNAARKRRELSQLYGKAGRWAEAVETDKQVLAILEKNKDTKPSHLVSTRGELIVFL